MHIPSLSYRDRGTKSNKSLDGDGIDRAWAVTSKNQSGGRV